MTESKKGADVCSITTYDRTRSMFDLSRELQPRYDIQKGLEAIHAQNPDINGDGLPDRFEITHKNMAFTIDVYLGEKDAKTGQLKYAAKPVELFGFIPYANATARITSLRWENQRSIADAYGSLIVETEGDIDGHWFQSTHTYTAIKCEEGQANKSTAVALQPGLPDPR